MADEKARAEQNRQDTNQNQNQNQNPPPAQPRRALDAFSRLPSAALIFLAFNTAVAVYRARGYPWPVAFVVLSFLDLLLMFHILHLLVAAPPNSNSPRRCRLRTAVWFLASFITAMLSYGVADMMLAVVWCAAALAVGLGFYWLSIYAPDSYLLPTDLKDDDICDML
ncbi:uncharacterized protein LOC109716906 [Ananas comosus]|uniref:Uncharacterized protein LOC109716906 n=1 Tax=Ananas comosus TaxID=4615 RepID=A0A199W866_ANACO|nr:uncharacterized protein LOC109716906 [Ananas comosus]OAY85408.1 hypothetical protein ACMD2_14145 [Ananas comosus]